MEQINCWFHPDMLLFIKPQTLSSRETYPKHLGGAKFRWKWEFKGLSKFGHSYHSQRAKDSLCTASFELFIYPSKRMMDYFSTLFQRRKSWESTLLCIYCTITMIHFVGWPTLFGEKGKIKSIQLFEVESSPIFWFAHIFQPIVYFSLTLLMSSPKVGHEAF